MSGITLRTQGLSKQWGAFNIDGKLVGKHKAGRLLGGRTWDGLPLRPRNEVLLDSGTRARPLPALA